MTATNKCLAESNKSRLINVEFANEATWMILENARLNERGLTTRFTLYADRQALSSLSVLL